MSKFYKLDEESHRILINTLSSFPIKDAYNAFQILVNLKRVNDIDVDKNKK